MKLNKIAAGRSYFDALKDHITKGNFEDAYKPIQAIKDVQNKNNDGAGNSTPHPPTEPEKNASYTPFAWADWIPEHDFRRGAVEKIASQQKIAAPVNSRILAVNYGNGINNAATSLNLGNKTVANRTGLSDPRFGANGDWLANQAIQPYRTADNSNRLLSSGVIQPKNTAQPQVQAPAPAPAPVAQAPVAQAPVAQAPVPARPPVQPQRQVANTVNNAGQRPAPAAPQAQRPQTQPNPQTTQPAAPNPAPQVQRSAGVPTLNNQDKSYMNRVAQTQASPRSVSQVTGQQRSQAVSNMIARGRSMNQQQNQTATPKPINNNTQQTNSAARPTQSGVAPKAQISSGGRGNTQPTANPQQVANASTTPNRQIPTASSNQGSAARIAKLPGAQGTFSSNVNAQGTGTQRFQGTVQGDSVRNLQQMRASGYKPQYSMQNRASTNHAPRQLGR